MVLRHALANLTGKLGYFVACDGPGAAGGGAAATARPVSLARSRGRASLVQRRAAPYLGSHGPIGESGPATSRPSRLQLVVMAAAGVALDDLSARDRGPQTRKIPKVP